MPLLLVDLNIPLMKFSQCMRFILRETAHYGLAKSAVIRTPSVLLAEVGLIFLDRLQWQFSHFLSDLFNPEFGDQKVH